MLVRQLVTQLKGKTMKNNLFAGSNGIRGVVVALVVAAAMLVGASAFAAPIPATTPPP